MEYSLIPGKTLKYLLYFATNFILNSLVGLPLPVIILVPDAMPDISFRNKQFQKIPLTLDINEFKFVS